MSRPDDSREQALAAELGVAVDRIAGVDEVGRGPLAGPVCAGAVMLAGALPVALRATIHDSKKLSESQRLAIAGQLGGLPGVTAALGWASVAEIAEHNILGAALLAMRRAVGALGRPAAGALVDGHRDPKLGIPTRLIKGGDGLSLSIAAASILAKTARDAEMRRLHADFPGYGWDRNAGYPTAEHRDALRRLGPTPYHRQGFKGVLARDP